mmetsp:Transcript_71269/g.152328  ORF Transcript_71269/g.152328 Transcript_71269/m.152328 type:complete len:325 (+) Transcript_71269:237-1211(+)
MAMHHWPNVGSLVLQGFFGDAMRMFASSMFRSKDRENNLRIVRLDQVETLTHDHAVRGQQVQVVPSIPVVREGLHDVGLLHLLLFARIDLGSDGRQAEEALILVISQEGLQTGSHAQDPMHVHAVSELNLEKLLGGNEGNGSVAPWQRHDRQLPRLQHRLLLRASGDKVELLFLVRLALFIGMVQGRIVAGATTLSRATLCWGAALRSLLRSLRQGRLFLLLGCGSEEGPELDGFTEVAGFEIPEDLPDELAIPGEAEEVARVQLQKHLQVAQHLWVGQVLDVIIVLHPLCLVPHRLARLEPEALPFHGQDAHLPSQVHRRDAE